MPVIASIPSVAAEIAAGDEISLLEIATERRLNVSTTNRWVTHGVPGRDGVRVRLAAIQRGKKWLTSRAALKRFFESMPSNQDAPQFAEAI